MTAPMDAHDAKLRALARLGVTQADVNRARAEFDAALSRKDYSALRGIALSNAYQAVTYENIINRVKQWADGGVDDPGSLPHRLAAEACASNMQFALLNVYCEHLKAQIAALEKRLTESEQRVAATEASPFKFVGGFVTDRMYERGECVVYGGSTFHCNRTTKERPGDGHDWTLMARRGRDGKDAH